MTKDPEKSSIVVLIVVPIVVAIIGALGFIISASIRNNGSDSPTAFNSKEICQNLKISNYENQDEIPIDVKSQKNQIKLEGKTGILNQKYLLWIIGQPEGSSNFFPFSKPAVIQSDGNWSSFGFTGVYKERKPYTFIPIILNEENRSKLEPQLSTKQISQIPVPKEQICSSTEVIFIPN